MADREKVIEHFKDALNRIEPADWWVSVRKDFIEDAIELLEEQEIKEQISDAVHETAKQFRREIVRCKDCKHWTKALGGQCNILTVNGCAHCTSPDWFCADGERDES